MTETKNTKTRKATVKAPATPTPAPAKKEYKATDLIPCTSLVEGELLMPGGRTGTLYRWAGADETINVEYQDLIKEILSRNSGYVYSPYFLIDDPDLVSQHKALVELYAKVVKPAEILEMPIPKMERTIKNLPKALQDSLKVYVATAIDEGDLDSIKVISVIDSVLGTKLLLESKYAG